MNKFLTKLRRLMTMKNLIYFIKSTKKWQMSNKIRKRMHHKKQFHKMNLKEKQEVNQKVLLSIKQIRQASNINKKNQQKVSNYQLKIKKHYNNALMNLKIKNKANKKQFNKKSLIIVFIKILKIQKLGLIQTILEKIFKFQKIQQLTYKRCGVAIVLEKSLLNDYNKML